MYAIDLGGKNALVFGVANQRSIAWHIARALDRAGASVTLSYLNERIRSSVEKLSGQLSSTPTLIECDVSDDTSIERAFEKLESEVGGLDIVVHSIAFANRDDLGGPFIDTPREGFRIALDISAYSLVSVARAAAPLMKENGGSIVTMTFQASGRVFPGYNVMGTAKAALENEVRQLAWDLGRDNIRINAISARAGRYAFVTSNKRLPGHEAGTRRSLPDGEEHNPRRGGEHRPVPLQRYVVRHHGRGAPRGHRLQRHGYLEK